MTNQTCATLAPTLLALARSRLTDISITSSEATALDAISWDDLCDLAKHHDLLPLVSAGVAASGFRPPAGALEMLRKSARVAKLRSDRAWSQIAEMLEAFNRCDIAPILLKGAQVARRYYPTPGMRAFGDIDIAVKPEDRERAANILLEIGYRNTDDQTDDGKSWCVENHFHWTFIRERMFHVELHWNLAFPQSAIPLDVNSFWSRAEIEQTPEGRYRALADDDDLLFLACHITRHCFKIPLRSHMDIAAILWRSPNLD